MRDKKIHNLIEISQELLKQLEAGNDVTGIKENARYLLELYGPTSGAEISQHNRKIV